MKDAVKAEFKKLLSVRSTYVLTALVLLFISFIAFYVEGWRLKPGELTNPGLLNGDVFGALSLSIFGAVIAILMVTHEYRYNTIIYTLASTNRRSRVLWAKAIVISCYALVLTALICAISPILSYWGVHAAGHNLAAQAIYYKDDIWRGLFYGWSYGLIGMIIALIVRVQAGAIVALFVIPAIIEPLLSQLLNKNAVYLPFTALSQVAGNGSINGATSSAGQGALVFLIYLAVAWLAAWYLFLKRDAA